MMGTTHECQCVRSESLMKVNDNDECDHIFLVIFNLKGYYLKLTLEDSQLRSFHQLVRFPCQGISILTCMCGQP